MVEELGSEYLKLVFDLGDGELSNRHVGLVRLLKHNSGSLQDTITESDDQHKPRGARARRYEA